MRHITVVALKEFAIFHLFFLLYFVLFNGCGFFYLFNSFLHFLKKKSKKTMKKKIVNSVNGAMNGKKANKKINFFHKISSKYNFMNRHLS